MTDEIANTDTSAQSEPTLSREAAAYRVRLRQAEAERDQARAQLATARKELVTGSPAFRRISEEARSDAFDLADDETRAGFFGDDGRVNEDAVKTWADKLAIERPYMSGRHCIAVENMLRGLSDPGPYRPPKRDPLKSAVTGR